MDETTKMLKMQETFLGLRGHICAGFFIHKWDTVQCKMLYPTWTLQGKRGMNSSQPPEL